MNGIRTGNSVVDGARRKGWILGHFVEEDVYRQSQDVEVKWGIHRKGETNEAFATDVLARTLSILLRGKFRLVFRQGAESKEVVLVNEGDYALWLPGVAHTWIAEADDTVILTVRWPSSPHSQKRASGGPPPVG